MAADAAAPQHDEHGDHPWFLGHHWGSATQQFEAGKLGMWLFLATEVLLFGGLFCAYAIWRGNNPGLFKYGSQFLDTKWGAINTAVLITSSLTMAWAVTAAQRNQQTLLKILLCLTLCGAVGFMGIKYVEYTHKFHEGWLPGFSLYENEALQEQATHLPQDESPAEAVSDESRSPEPPVPGTEVSIIAPAAVGPGGVNTGVIDHADGVTVEPEDADEAHAAGDAHGAHLTHPALDPDRPANAHMFFNIYFMMTGLHGIHVIIGGIVIVWLLVGAMRGRFSDKYFTPVDLGGLYWHVVDLIWIFLFPLFYLI